jgi:hypothetical protein
MEEVGGFTNDSFFVRAVDTNAEFHGLVFDAKLKGIHQTSIFGLLKEMVLLDFDLILGEVKNLDKKENVER